MLDLQELLPPLPGLTELDVSSIKHATASQISTILGSCTALKRLIVRGNPQLNEEEIMLNLGLGRLRPGQALPENVALPSLQALDVGWGFGGRVLLLLLHSSPFLTKLSVGIGAEFGDWHLAQAVKLCPHIRQLHLHLANVSDEGSTCLSSETMLNSMYGPDSINNIVAYLHRFKETPK